MIQQLLAILVIIFFFTRILNQKRKKKISNNEFWLWTFFWAIASLAIIFIKQIDQLAKMAGFSSSGINLLLYLAVMALFYLVFKLRLKMARQDQEITNIVRNIAIKQTNEEKK
ncbi:MAG: DUF2304 domain-containing protein [Planctomycetes bacterium]|jgi:hypothetical protein|nr:DUF2304 domain-containing protein [Planctomycetota bacterium]